MQMVELGIYNLISSNTDKLIAVIMLFAISIFLRILLQLLGQSWIKSIPHTATLALLPILTYIITSVISGNIALSLGMVGALSIVRFRNPVRSPLELSVYFCAITMGITAAVSLMWLTLLVGSVSMVGIGLYVLNKLVRVLSGVSFFTASFSEGTSLSSLSVTASSSLEVLDDSEYLISKSITNSEWNYVLAFRNFSKLKQISEDIETGDAVLNLSLRK